MAGVNLKYFFFRREWGAGEEVARASEFFTEHPNLKKIILGVGMGDRGYVGGRGELMDRHSNRPKPICPFNFFVDGGITMHKCTFYGHDKLN